MSQAEYEMCPHGRHVGAYCEPCAEDAGAEAGNLRIEMDHSPLVENRYPDYPDFDQDLHKILDSIADDAVNSPPHYTVGGYEAIDVIEAKLTKEEYRGYLKGNALKYLMRANYKGHHNEDIEKAQWYLRKLADTLSQDVSAISVEES